MFKTQSQTFLVLLGHWFLSSNYSAPDQIHTYIRKNMRAGRMTWKTLPCFEDDIVAVLWPLISTSYGVLNIRISISYRFQDGY
jgi:hypothetical protein